MEGPYVQIAAVAIRAHKRSMRVYALPVADKPLIIRPCMGTSPSIVSITCSPSTGLGSAWLACG